MEIMANLSCLDQKIDALSRQMTDLKHIKYQVATRKERNMDGWLVLVEDRERELADEIKKEFEILRKEDYDVINLKALDTLSQKVIENLKAVNLLRDEGNASLESSPVHSNKMKHKTFSLEDLIKYTSNFLTKVGSGGFSNVFKGQLDDGKQVAVKVLTNTVLICDFMAEMHTMVIASHPNLVTLYGFCFDFNMKALVYEFMDNGSLDKILFDNHLSLEWGELYKIVVEIAKGLTYLHGGCGKQIIHPDMKPANVLLDENHSAKITDFGLAKFLSKDANYYTITRDRGTYGYIAPEFRNPLSQITNKCDVYSFGVMLFEILAKRHNGKFGPDWFPVQIWYKFEKGHLDEHIKSFGIPEIHKGKAKTLSMVAFWCCQYTVELRPSMSTVVEILEKGIQINTPPCPFREYFPPPDISMLPSQEVILEIQSEATPIIHERPVIANQTLVEESDIENGSFDMILEFQSEATPIIQERPVIANQTLVEESDIENGSFDMILEFQSEATPIIHERPVIANQTLVEESDIENGSFDMILEIQSEATPIIHERPVIANQTLVEESDIENGSFDMILYEDYPHLEWEQLYEIAIETAKELSVLHAVGFIHGDIKASKIFLNSNLSPNIRTLGLKGSIGYSAPEMWMSTLEVTSKCDVYSFGMLLFEILMRRSLNNQRAQEWFPAQIWKMFTKGQLMKVIKDCKISTSGEIKAYTLCMVAFWCAQFHPQKRPPMNKVVKMLEMEIPFIDPPNLFVQVKNCGSSVSRFYWGATHFGELSFHEQRAFEERAYCFNDDEDSWEAHDSGNIKVGGGDWNKARELDSVISKFGEICPPGGENSVVLYTRTVRWLGRFNECNNVRSILESHQIKIFERSLSANSDYSFELRKLLGRIEVPALFIHGRFIGGVKEVKSLEEEGMLKILLYGIQVENQ